MNKILFLPFNRNLSYFALRALRRGHLPLLKRWAIESHKGRDSSLFMKWFFKRDWSCLRRGPLYIRWCFNWRQYFAGWKVTHLVTDTEANLAVLAALDVARELGIVTSYVAHGEGHVYYFKGEADWYTKAYDYLYVRNHYLKGHYDSFGDDCKVRKFSPSLVNPPLSESLPARVILYAPLHAGILDKRDNLVSSANHDLRCRYNRIVLKVLAGSKYKVLWCQDPRMDRRRNPILSFVADAYREGRIEWIKDRAPRWLDKTDMALTDVGSAFFFEAINAGKPTLCLYHKPTAAPLKPGTERLFGSCLQSFSNREELWTKLTSFLEGDPKNCYVPWKYVNRERMS